MHFYLYAYSTFSPIVVLFIKSFYCLRGGKSAIILVVANSGFGNFSLKTCILMWIRCWMLLLLSFCQPKRVWIRSRNLDLETWKSSCLNICGIYQKNFLFRVHGVLMDPTRLHWLSPQINHQWITHFTWKSLVLVSFSSRYWPKYSDPST
jgi:hypothetical protein